MTQQPTKEDRDFWREAYQRIDGPATLSERQAA